MHIDVPILPTILTYPFRQASPKMQGNHKLLLDLLQIRRYPGFEKKMWVRGPHKGKDLRHCAKQPNSKEPFSGHHLRLNHYTRDRSIRDFEIKLNTHRLNTDKYRVTPSTGTLHKFWIRDLNEVVDRAAAALRCELYTEGNTLLAKEMEREVVDKAKAEEEERRNTTKCRVASKVGLRYTAQKCVGVLPSPHLIPRPWYAPWPLLFVDDISNGEYRFADFSLREGESQLPMKLRETARDSYAVTLQLLCSYFAVSSYFAVTSQLRTQYAVTLQLLMYVQDNIEVTFLCFCFMCLYFYASMLLYPCASMLLHFRHFYASVPLQMPSLLCFYASILLYPCMCFYTTILLCFYSSTPCFYSSILLHPYVLLYSCYTSLLLCFSTSHAHPYVLLYFYTNLLYLYASMLLYFCTSIPLRFYASILLYFYTSILLYFYTSMLLPYTSVLLYFYASILLCFYVSSSKQNTPKCRCPRMSA